MSGCSPLMRRYCCIMGVWSERPSAFKLWILIARRILEPMNVPQPRYRVGPDSDEARQILDAIDRWLEREVESNVMRRAHADVRRARMVDQMRGLVVVGATTTHD